MRVRRLKAGVMKQCVIGCLGAMLVCCLPVTGRAQQERVIANGQRLYQWYCEFCHGVGGKGDGPLAAKLLVKPIIPALAAA